MMEYLAQLFASQNGVIRYAGPFVFGVVAHVCVFRVGEWDKWTTKLLVAFLAAQGLLAICISKFDPGEAASPLQACRTAALLSFTFLSGVYSSILTYRAIFHRLNGFPGPFQARLSNLFVTRLSVKKFQLYEEIRSLHAQYGDVVRVGIYLPSRLFPGTRHPR